MDHEFQHYINELLKNLDLTNEEKKELEEELKSHLIDLKNEYMDDGMTEEESVKQSINTFGHQEYIQKGIKAAINPYHGIYRMIGVLGGLAIIVFSFLIEASIETSIPAGVDFYEFERSIMTFLSLGIAGAFIYLANSKRKLIQKIVSVITILIMITMTYVFYTTEAKEIEIDDVKILVTERVSLDRQIDLDDIEIVNINDALMSGTYIINVKFINQGNARIEMNDRTGEIIRVDYY